MSVSCLCLVFPEFPVNSVRCLDSVRILRPVSASIMSVVRHFLTNAVRGSVCLDFSCLDSVPCPNSVQTLEKSCPLSVCPAGQRRDRAVRTFAVLVRQLSLRSTKTWSAPIPESYRIMNHNEFVICWCSHAFNARCRSLRFPKFSKIRVLPDCL